MKKQTLKDFLKYTRNDANINIVYFVSTDFLRERMEVFSGTYEDFKKKCKPLFGEFVGLWDDSTWEYSDGSGKFTQIDIEIEGNLLGVTWAFTDEEDDTDDIWKKL